MRAPILSIPLAALLLLCGASSARNDFERFMAIRALPADERIMAVPAFDCTKAYSSDEITICSDQDLSLADEAMDAGLRAVISETSASAATLESQQAWARRRKACGSNKRCLLAAYNERISELSKALGASPQPR